MSNKPIFVTFGDKKIENEFEQLKSGKFEDKQLYDFIEKAIKDLKLNPISGIKISKNFMAKGIYKKVFDHKFMEI